MVASLSAICLAETCKEAKIAGKVIEKGDGYIKAVQIPTSPEIQILVENTNVERAQEYAKIAKENNITLEEAALLMAEHLK